MKRKDQMREEDQLGALLRRESGSTVPRELRQGVAANEGSGSQTAEQRRSRLIRVATFFAGFGEAEEAIMAQLL